MGPLYSGINICDIQRDKTITAPHKVTELCFVRAGWMAVHAWTHALCVQHSSAVTVCVNSSKYYEAMSVSRHSSRTYLHCQFT